MSYTGTVLGGRLDGEIITLDQPHLVLPEPISRGFYTHDLPPTPTTIRTTHYRWVQDDDARGWWIQER